jgi:putative transposase
VIHELVNTKELSRGEQERLIRNKCARRWIIPFSNRTRIGRTTILRWVRLYKAGNGKIESLMTSSRSDLGASRSMDEESCLSLIGLRREFPRITIKDLISKMREKDPEVRLNPSSVHRLLKREGLNRPAQQKPEDRRKYEAELANDIWQSDVMHGPMVRVGDKMRKSYLIAFLDDHPGLFLMESFIFPKGLPAFWMPSRWDCSSEACQESSIPITARHFEAGIWSRFAHRLASPWSTPGPIGPKGRGR